MQGDKHKFIERKKRALKIARELKELFPERKTALSFSTPWELLVATVLSAQCTDKKVNEITPYLFRVYPKVINFSHARLEDIEKIIYSTGFYKSKARYCKLAALYIIEHYNGIVPSDIESLVKIPGVGRKTAVVVQSNAFNIIEGIAVDTHVSRFAYRFDLSDNSAPKKIEQDLCAILPKEEWFAFHNNLIYYGREYCKAQKHDCSSHPLTKLFEQANNRWKKRHV